MVRIKIKYFAICLLLLLINCGSHSKFSKLEHIELSKKYKDICLSKRNKIKKDTIYIENNKVCIFDKGRSFEIGEIKNNKKRGVWYFYRKDKDKYICNLIRNVNKKNGSYIWSLGFPNKRW